MVKINGLIFTIFIDVNTHTHNESLYVLIYALFYDSLHLLSSLSPFLILKIISINNNEINRLISYINLVIN